MKKLLTTSLAAALLSTTVLYSPSFAAEQKTEPSAIATATKQQKNITNQRELSRDEIEKLAKQYGQDPSKIAGATYYQFESPGPNPQSNSIAPAAVGDTYLKNLDARTTGGNIFFRDNAIGAGTYEATIKDSLSTEVSYELSSKTGLSVNEISGKLGVKVVIGQEFSRKYTVTVPAGKRYTIYAAPNYNHYSYEVWKKGWFSDSYLGTFYLNDPMGITVWHQDTTGWG